VAREGMVTNYSGFHQTLLLWQVLFWYIISLWQKNEKETPEIIYKKKAALKENFYCSYVPGE
jgi:hypothetical protein